jgi:hypothetical protein
MSEPELLPWKLYNGLKGHYGMAIVSVRTDPKTQQHFVRSEFVEALTEIAALTAFKLRFEDLEKDPTMVRIVVSVVSSERRREPAKEAFGPIVLPFNRINGQHP